ncbi:MAG: hypothetical protein H6631_11250 [Anaerolineaceae bacterium]|nr:hypothetical protein [Anaerolineaceae bacterium]MCB9098649.1 hypothetical protein [Anaerolineales bacterium]
MNTDIISGKVKQAVGNAKYEQAKQGIDSVSKALEGKREEVAGVAQETYGYVIEKAQQVVDNLTSKTDEAKQQVDTRLSDYNNKLAAAADHLPGDVNRTIVRYPWMTIVAVLALGLVIGFWLKPCFKKYEYKYQYPAEPPQNF